MTSTVRLIREHPDHIGVDGIKVPDPLCVLCQTSSPAGSGPELLPSLEAPGESLSKGAPGARNRRGDSIALATTIKWLRDHDELIMAVDLTNTILLKNPSLKPVVAVAWI